VRFMDSNKGCGWGDVLSASLGGWCVATQWRTNWRSSSITTMPFRPKIYPNWRSIVLTGKVHIYQQKQYLTILEYILNYFDFVMGKNSLFYCPGKGE
jgi:hypothetical protein